MNYNAGEWSEAYLLLKLISAGRIHAGDEAFNRIDNTYMDVEAVMKRNLDNVLECDRKGAVVECWLIYDDGTQSERIVFPIDRFSEMAEMLLQEIKNRPRTGSFSITQAETFLQSIGDESIKAGVVREGSAYEEAFKGKTDIVLRIVYQGENSILGFSVKSALGSPATLFNAAAASAFEYRLDNCTHEDFLKLNDLVSASGHPDVIKRVDYIRNNCIRMRFTHTRIGEPNARNRFTEAGPHFQWNLELLDSRMPVFISETLLVRYGYYGTPVKKCKDIIAEIEKLNPLNVRNPIIYYRTKLEDFVYASFGQMTATREWDGRHVINGGYIEIKNNGEVLYYRATSDDKFKGFLVNKTHFESPSTNPSKKHYHGCVEKRDGGYYMSLNFSVRF